MKPLEEASFPKALGLFVFGPVIAAVHFFGLYLFAEISCAAEWLQVRIVGIDGVAVVALAATVVAAGATVALSVAAYRRRRLAHGSLVFTGFLLGVTFAIEIVFVGITPAFLRSCA